MDKAKYYYRIRKIISRKPWGKSYFTALQEYTTGKRWQKETKPGFFEMINGPCAYLAPDQKSKKKMYRKFRRRHILFGFSCEEFFRKQSFNMSIIQCGHLVSDFRTRWLNEMLNRKDVKHYLGDKTVFATYWADYFGRAWCDESSSLDDFTEAFRYKKRVIVKPKGGGKGKKIQTFDITENIKETYEEIRKKYSRGYIAEEYYNQTGFMHELNPSTLNTIRVVTVRKGKDGKIWPVTTFTRIGTKDTVVDNYTEGGVLYDVDIYTGEIGQGMFKAAIGKPLVYHPGTDVSYIGLIIPRWQEVLDFCCKVHEIAPEGLDYIGWDVCLSENEIILIEGNSWPEFGKNTGKHENQWKRVLPALEGRTNVSNAP